MQRCAEERKRLQAKLGKAGRSSYDPRCLSPSADADTRRHKLLPLTAAHGTRRPLSVHVQVHPYQVPLPRPLPRP